MLKVVGASGIRIVISFSILVGVLIFGIFIILICRTSKDDEKYAATVYWDPYTEQYQINLWGQNNDPAKISRGIARAYFQSSMYKIGWSVLEIETTAKYTDEDQAFAAGILEGALSWKYIYWQWTNTIEQPCIHQVEFCKEVREFLTNNTASIKATATKNDEVDPFWHQVKLFYTQLKGLEFGWHYEVKKNRETYSIPKIDFLWMNIMSDLKDIENVIYPSKNVNHSSSTAMLLLKLLSKNNGTFVLAHSSSGFYSSMLRIQKKYNFNYHITGSPSSELIPGRIISFTSYPGSIHSQDDFYLIVLENKSKITVTGTAIDLRTNKNRNRNEMKNLVFLGPRVMAANRLTRDGKSWSTIIEKFNSGTGNKQWLHIQPKNDKIEFWIIEQISQIIISKNETKLLYQQGYWISCGISYYKESKGQYPMKQNMDKRSNYSVIKGIEQVLKLGQQNVTDIQSLINLMRGPDLSLVGRTDLQITQESIMNFNSTSFKSAATHKTQNNSFARHDSVSNRTSHRLLKYIYYNLNQKNVVVTRYERWYHLLQLKNVVSLARQPRNNNQKLTNATTLTLFGKNNNTMKEKRFQIINGIIDLKVMKDNDYFLATAGPPFNLNDKHRTIEPFQWSKSRIRYLPHDGHSDVWNYKPVAANFVWN